MLKMWGLIKNEYKKLFKRGFTKFALISIAVVCLGFFAIFRFLVYPDGYDGDPYYNYYTLSDEMRDEIYRLEKDVEAGFLPDEELAEVEQKLEYYRYVLDKGYARSDWIYTSGAVSEMFDKKWQCDDISAEISEYTQNGEPVPSDLQESLTLAKTEYDILARAVENVDWKEFYQYEIDYAMPALYGDVEHLSEVDRLRLENSRAPYQYLIENGIAPDDKKQDWKTTIVFEISRAKDELIRLSHEEKVDGDSLEEAQNTVAILEYRLAHNIKVDISGAIEGKNSLSKYWYTVSEASSLAILVGILVIVIAGSIISSEFSQGTIKFLLINPETRGKIFWSKYLTVLSLGLFMLIEYFVSSMILGLVFFGFGEAFLPIVTASGGVAHAATPFFKMLGKYFLRGTEILVMATLAFMVSSLFRSSIASIAFGLGSYLVGSGAVSILYEGFQLDFVRYLIFANMDLATIRAGESMIINHSFPFAVCVVAVHLVIFLLTAYDGFVRREV